VCSGTERGRRGRRAVVMVPHSGDGSNQSAMVAVMVVAMHLLLMKGFSFTFCSSTDWTSQTVRWRKRRRRKRRRRKKRRKGRMMMIRSSPAGRYRVMTALRAVAITWTRRCRKARLLPMGAVGRRPGRRREWEGPVTLVAATTSLHPRRRTE
jgi:hypothetical protein